MTDWIYEIACVNDSHVIAFRNWENAANHVWNRAVREMGEKELREEYPDECAEYELHNGSFFGFPEYLTINEIELVG